MKSIFDPQENQDLLRRLSGLTGNSKPLWGKMTAAQMVAHAQRPLLVATGELPLSRGLLGVLFGKLAKKKLLEEKPLPKNQPTHPKFVVKHQPDFEEEKQKLLDIVERFGRVGPPVLTHKPHPFFGPMTTSEWDKLQWKHLDHHLRQFGL